MLKVIKILGILDVSIAIIWAALWLTTRNANDFSGLIVIYPLIGFTIVTIALLVLYFIYALLRGLKPTKTQRVHQTSWTIWNIILLTAMPAVGLLYASRGEGRIAFAVFCTILLVCGVVVSIVTAFRLRR